MKGVGWAVAALFLIGATPSPSPTLDTVLAPPPAGFVKLTTALLHGHFTAEDYASSAEASKQSSVLATMKRDGFVDGFSSTWVSQSSQHVLVEAALAFTGGRGAHSWLTAVEAADKKDARYVREDTMPGLGTYYGAHLADTASKTYGDEFSFVKGNDVFVVVVVSTKDDALNQAMSQSTAQYSAAPDETIPSGQWPENQSTPASNSYTAGFLVFLILAVLVSATTLVIRRRRRAVVPALAGVQMSPDGNYWWDGQSWRDAARETPPFAQRSAGGALWWDGRTWRPTPQPPVSEPPAW
ncbi:MAG TPA: hypothetical protein VJR46_05485 [Candidatus Dormibacteraeota bacterium]|nr:hypothetical protein [Candidatus Dormibacteraeota bacterium]